MSRPPESPEPAEPREPLPVWPDAPRHRPEAPLPSYRFQPGVHPHPRRDPDGSLYGFPEHAPGLPASEWRQDESWLVGLDLYHQGYLWEAHEALEACYFASEDRRDRALVQGVIQLAAALLQHHRRIENGVRRLARASHTKLVAAVDDDAPTLRGIDVAALASDVARHFAAALGDGDPLEVAGRPPRLAVSD